MALEVSHELPRKEVSNETWKYEKAEDTSMCRYWIKRKQRSCRHRAADGNLDGFCSDHSKEGLYELRRLELNQRILHECRETLSSILDEICQEEPLNMESKKRKRERSKRISAPKRMANPFSVDLSPDLGVVNLSEWFTSPKNPIHVDIGCAKGRCIERLSQKPERAEWNHLGVEIRPGTVNEAIERVRHFPNYQLSQRKNLHFLACNFVASLDQLLSTFPSAALSLISIQFPDPWRRKKHLKRMLVQEELVIKLSGHLSSGSLIYLSSDSNRVMLWMVQKFIQSNFFKLIKAQEIKDLPDNVFFLPSSSSVAERGDGVASVGSDSEVTVATARTKEEDEDEENEEDLDDEEKENNEKETEKENNEIERLNEYWIDYNPLGELSERELICEVDWRKVKRCVLVRV